MAQAELVHSGQVTPTELVDAAIARIEERNGALNAVVTTAFEKARGLATVVDRNAPLAGVPFLIKDQLDWAGVRTTHGSRFLRDHIASANSPIVQRWLDAGVVPLGKTNTPECGLLATTEPLAHGVTRNPWDLTRTAGGSSGGSAAAVAARMVPAASASDGGGSIRIPAAACGLVGLKPSRGRTPNIGWGGLSVAHVLTRTVRDSAGFLDVASVSSPGSFLSAIDTRPERLRVAVTTDAWEGVRYAPEVLKAVEHTGALLRELGHDVVPGRPDLSPALIASVLPKLQRAFVPVSIARSLDAWSTMTGKPLDESDFEPLTWRFATWGREMTGSKYADALEAQRQLTDAITPFFDKHDVWLLPSLGELPPEHGVWQFPQHDPTFGFFRMTMFVPPLSTPLANYTGQPAISLPLEHDDATGLPVGVQFYGRYGDEATLLRVARQLEEARPWAERSPPGSGAPHRVS